MIKNSPNRVCVCCNKKGNNVKQMIYVTSEKIIASLISRFPASNVSHGNDVCKGCIDKAYWHEQKMNRNNTNTENINNNDDFFHPNNNENSLNNHLDSSLLGKETCIYTFVYLTQLIYYQRYICRS
jgi:hypothetical protein